MMQLELKYKIFWYYFIVAFDQNLVSNFNIAK